MRLVPKLAAAALIGLTLAWLLPVAHYEWLTWRHGHEFIGLEQHTAMLDKAQHVKVLSYSQDAARVYYVGSTGDILSFSAAPSRWTLVHWETLWSKSGSADGYVWPYFYHSAQGIAVFALLAAPFSLALGATAYGIRRLRR